MSKYLENSSNVWVFGEFPKCLGILEISNHLRNFQNLKNIPPLNTYRYLGNFPDTQAFGKFPRHPGIWEISQIPRHLGNFPDTQAIGKFPKFL